MKKSKLNIGSGEDYKKGYINLDSNKEMEFDICHNLNDLPLPFEDNTFDEVYCSHILEHTNNLIDIMNEIKRICKPNAIIKIISPHFSSGTSYRDPTHINKGFSLYTFDYFDDMAYYNLSKFKVIKRRLDFLGEQNIKLYPFMKIINIPMNFLINLFPKFYERFTCWMFPCFEFYVELECVK